jgi:Domain of unknown function (DUF1841)
MSNPTQKFGSNSTRANVSMLSWTITNPELHAIAHVVVENQVALGEATSVPATLDRLMHEGLDRHEAIHAIASILMSIVSDVTREADDGGDINAKYGRELAKLTAAGWRSQAE